MTNQEPQFESDRWAHEMGDKWDRYLDQFESGIRAVGEAAVDAAHVRAGERILDVGCGGGLTTQWLAACAGPTGTATGVDISSRLVDSARRRARDAGAGNVSFICGDAGRIDLGGPYDVLFSRFGVMFFDEPRAAFRHMRKFLAPGARVMLACWGPPEQNPWVGVLMSVARRYVDMQPQDPHRPGPFAFADREYLTELLQQAGFASIEITPWHGEQSVGGERATAASATSFVMNALFIGDLLADLAPDAKAHAERDLRAVLEQHEKDGAVRLGAMAWLVGARAA